MKLPIYIILSLILIFSINCGTKTRKSNINEDIEETNKDNSVDTSKTKDVSGTSKLHEAIKSNDLKKARLSIKEGEDVKKADDEFRTPVHLACEMGNIDMVNLLLEKGVDIEEKNENGETPLIIAVLYGKKDLVKFLISKGANVNAKDSDGISVLDMVDEEENPEIAVILRKAGAKER
ncbi:MAG: ankyrin repeat domain-containing protein [Candidatus Coatesbacteria bacterium]|nr:ankyrin repeat domain-containing protein [Candidatus Coatesbacteria bacterium]